MNLRNWENEGLLHVYCGEGKGKTTAALGLALRAAGSGMRVLIVQFLKSAPTGELVSLEKIPNIHVLRGKEGNHFSFQMTMEEKENSKRIHTENLREAIRAAQAGECDMLILDEGIGAYNREVIDTELFADFVSGKPERLELVVTGRNPSIWMVDEADYVTKINSLRHPYDKGIPARKGIER